MAPGVLPTPGHGLPAAALGLQRQIGTGCYGGGKFSAAAAASPLANVKPSESLILERATWPSCQLEIMNCCSLGCLNHETVGAYYDYCPVRIYRLGPPRLRHSGS